MHKNRHRVDKNPVFLFCVWLNLGWWGNKGGAVELVGADGAVGIFAVGADGIFGADGVVGIFGVGSIITPCVMVWWLFLG